MFTRVVDGQKVWIQGNDDGACWSYDVMCGCYKVTKVVLVALTGIIVVAALAIGLGLDVSTVGSFIREGGGDGLQFQPYSGTSSTYFIR